MLGLGFPHSGCQCVEERCTDTLGTWYKKTCPEVESQHRRAHYEQSGRFQPTHTHTFWCLYFWVMTRVFPLSSEPVFQPRRQAADLQGQLWEGVHGLDREVLQNTGAGLPAAERSPKLHEICEWWLMCLHFLLLRNKVKPKYQGRQLLLSLWSLSVCRSVSARTPTCLIASTALLSLIMFDPLILQHQITCRNQTDQKIEQASGRKLLLTIL